MSNFNILFVVSLLILIVSITKADEDGYDTQQEGDNDDLKYTELMSRLKYGDSCSWKAEKLRRHLAKELLFSATNVTAKIEIVEKFKSTMLKNGEPVCNALGLFVCSKETNTCVCGDPAKSTVTGQQPDDNAFVVEEDDNGLKKCRWAKNSFCVSEDYYNSSKTASTVSSDSKCQKGTSCQTTEKHTTCDFTDILFYAIKNKITDASALAKAVYAGKICTCGIMKEGQVQESQDSENRHAPSSRVRRFVISQGSTPDLGIYGGILAPFVGSI